MAHRHAGALWIGGSTCSGKSTLAREHAVRTGYPIYSADDTFDEHARRLPGSRLAAIAAMAVGERLTRPPEAQAADVWAIAEERWPLILADLDSLPGRAIVEGECLLPANLASLGVAPAQVTFLFITPAERRRRYSARQWAREHVAGCADPDAAFEAWMRRDDLVEERIRSEAIAAGYLPNGG
jgi:hypothetical protein